MASGSITRVWLLTLGAGVLAGLLAWLAGESTLDLIKAPRRPFNSKGMILQVSDRWGELTAEARNAAIAFSILGGAVGFCFGAAGGGASGSTRRSLIAALMGLGVGVAGSAAMAAAVLSPYNAYRFRNPDEASQDLLVPLLIHSMIWAVAGLVGGLAFALGSGLGAVDRRLVAKVALAGLIGAIVGTVVFELAGTLVIAELDGGRLVASTSVGRLMARLAVTIGAAVAVALTVADRRNRPAVALAP